MPHFVIKSLKVGLWLIFPLLFTVNKNSDVRADGPILPEGTYVLKVKGECELLLHGAVNFTTVTKKTVKGKEYTAFELALKDDQMTAGHSLGFFISENLSSFKIDEGKYHVSRNIDGFLDRFSGVFGFANIDQYGELPFFTKNGSIKLNNIEENLVEGNMNVVFENHLGENLTMDGKFIALRK